VGRCTPPTASAGHSGATRARATPPPPAASTTAARARSTPLSCRRCTPATAALDFNRTDEPRWQRYALEAAWGTLAAHEWAKHGSCSAYHADQSAYFAAAEAALEHATAGSGAALVVPGTTVSRARLADAFASDTGAPPALRCGSDCALQEVWLGHGKREGDGGVDLSSEAAVDVSASGSCDACDEVAVLAWEGCPPRGSRAAAAAAMPPPPPPAPPPPPSPRPPRIRHWPPSQPPPSAAVVAGQWFSVISFWIVNMAVAALACWCLAREKSICHRAERAGHSRFDVEATTPAPPVDAVNTAPPTAT